MATVIPVSQPGNVEAAYEDMFKEITRKLYGEETGNGLHTLGTPVAHVATTGPTAPEGERSFTTLMSDRNIAPTIEYENNSDNGGAVPNSGNFKTEDHLTTAFGLAALMQNGAFPSTAGTILTGKSNINTSTSQPNNVVGVVASGSVNQAVNMQQEQRWAGTTSDEVLAWSATNGKLAAFSNQQKSTKIKREDQTDLFQEHQSGTSGQQSRTSSSGRKNKSQSNTANQQTQQIQIQKRYGCSHCSYSTDRRDLFTRHENIHKDEKPFQCYACLKQFNRADHVKKHFLRMHRESTYDINKTRRSVNGDQKPNVFSNQHQPNTNNQQQQQQQQQSSSGNYIATQQRNLNAVQDTSLSITQTIESVATAQLPIHPLHLKQERSPVDDKSTIVKIKREKRFSCCYCPWSGADKWGLKRHLNTHTKPYVCMLCDYKAARSERLATHVLKVHNKKACNKCSFLADTQEAFQAHISEVHPHDQRPPRNSNSSNVLRTIGNNILNNNQLNNFQNPVTSFSNIQTNNGGSSTVTYTGNDVTNTNNGLQEIVVSPASMVGWRLSANGTLIPPPHMQGLTDPPGPNQKRGAERLFQYLEADGSDPEDYARLLKMDAISRNTASVAQDFHNAGGVDSNKGNGEYYKTFYRNYQQTNPVVTIEAVSSSNKLENRTAWPSPISTANRKVGKQTENILQRLYEKKAMSHLYDDLIKQEPRVEEEEEPTKRSPPAFSIQQQSLNSRLQYTNSVTGNKGHRLLLQQQDKENSNSIFSNMEYQNFPGLGIQFQNYVKGVINKYYAETPLLYPNESVEYEKTTNTATTTIKSETQEYLEYLQKKGDITLIVNNNKNRSANLTNKSFNDEMPPIVTLTPNYPILNEISLTQVTTVQTPPSVIGNRRKRKQEQPKKIAKPQDIISILRDKYLNRMVDRKKSCIMCKESNKTLILPYHTAGSLLLHKIWHHTQHPVHCKICQMKCMRKYSLQIHMATRHRNLTRSSY